MSGGRVGCLCIEDWYRRYTGYAHGPETLAQWRQIPESFLATATNGEIFADPFGIFTVIREKLLVYYPEDIRIKKIVARAATMAQAGQYNYPRCVRRGDTVAADIVHLIKQLPFFFYDAFDARRYGKQCHMYHSCMMCVCLSL